MKLLLLIALLMPLQAYSKDLSSCDKALGLCQTLVKADDQEVLLLKLQVSNLEHRIEYDQNASKIPDVYWVILGVAAGSAITFALTR